MTDLRFLAVGHRRIAYRSREGSGPAILFLPGFASDMEGTKAVALDALAERHGLTMLRFDYSGTGSSDGDFEAGTLDLWLNEALAIVDHLIEGPIVLVGSSMGGWIALHIALRRPDRVAAIVGIAAAPDFTDWGFSDALREVLDEEGRLADPRDDKAPALTRAFWKSGQQLLLLNGEIDIHCPVRLLHGDADSEVPLDVAFQTIGQLRSADVQLTVFKGGGHRLSEPSQIGALLATVAALVEPDD